MIERKSDMTPELRKEIAIALLKVYERMRYDEDYAWQKIDRKFNDLATATQMTIELDDGNRLVGKPLFIACNDDDYKRNVLRRGDDVYVKCQEIWLVLFVTESQAHLMIKTVDRLRMVAQDVPSYVYENERWRVVDAEEMGMCYDKHDWDGSY